MKQFLLFGSNWAIGGALDHAGWKRYIGNYDSVQECENALKKNEADRDDGPGSPFEKWNWFQIVDTHTMKVVKEKI